MAPTTIPPPVNAPTAREAEASGDDAGVGEAEPGSAGNPPSRRAPWSLRLEQSRRGRWVLTVFIVITLGSLLVINAPATQTKKFLMVGGAPYLSALGLEQGWGVFAPNPRRFSLEVEAHIQQQDGSERVIPIESGRGVDEYWTYRWQRWADRLATGPDNNAMWDPYCRYLADQDRAAGGKPVRVALVNRRFDLLPPGSGASEKPPVMREFFAIGVSP